jgi:predicted lipid-binding transport protein (Tim44 family)
MKQKIKRLLMVLLVVLLIAIPFKVANADSGFDFDYDSGGSSWDSGSSWGDSDYSWSSSGDSSGGSFFGTLVIIIIVIIIIIIVSRNNKGGGGGINGSQFNDLLSQEKKMTDEEIQKIDPELNTDAIVNKAFNVYTYLQHAWTDFDTDKIRKLVSDELYNNYKMQLEGLKSRGLKNIMEDITKVGGHVVSLKKEGSVETACVALTVAMRDYIVDESGKVVRGNKAASGVSYFITIDKVSDKTHKVTNCPNCGGELGDEASQKCKFCGSNLVLASKDFIITKKENRKQRNTGYTLNQNQVQSTASADSVNINDYDKTIDNSMFKTKVDNIFVQLYTGLSKGDLKDVKHKISDKVYKEYKKKVDENKENKVKQMFDELNVKSTEITNIEEKDDKIVVTVKLVSRYMDYKVDVETKKYVSGNNTTRDEHTNILTLEKKKDAKDLKIGLHCPGCGQPANINESGHCKFCGATFNTEDYDYILTDIDVK